MTQDQFTAKYRVSIKRELRRRDYTDFNIIDSTEALEGKLKSLYVSLGII